MNLDKRMETAKKSINSYRDRMVKSSFQQESSSKKRRRPRRRKGASGKKKRRASQKTVEEESVSLEQDPTEFFETINEDITQPPDLVSDTEI